MYGIPKARSLNNSLKKSTGRKQRPLRPIRTGSLPLYEYNKPSQINRVLSNSRIRPYNRRVNNSRKSRKSRKSRDPFLNVVSGKRTIKKLKSNVALSKIKKIKVFINKVFLYRFSYLKKLAIQYKNLRENNSYNSPPDNTPRKLMLTMKKIYQLSTKYFDLLNDNRNYLDKVMSEDLERMLEYEPLRLKDISSYKYKNAIIEELKLNPKFQEPKYQGNLLFELDLDKLKETLYESRLQLLVINNSIKDLKRMIKSENRFDIVNIEDLNNNRNNSEVNRKKNLAKFILEIREKKTPSYVRVFLDRIDSMIYNYLGNPNELYNLFYSPSNYKFYPNPEQDIVMRDDIITELKHDRTEVYHIEPIPFLPSITITETNH